MSVLKYKNYLLDIIGDISFTKVKSEPIRKIYSKAFTINELEILAKAKVVKYQTFTDVHKNEIVAYNKRINGIRIDLVIIDERADIDFTDFNSNKVLK